MSAETARLIKLNDLAGFHEKDGEKASIVRVYEEGDSYFIVKRFLSGSPDILAIVCGQSGQIRKQQEKQSVAFIDRFIDGLNRNMESVLSSGKG